MGWQIGLTILVLVLVMPLLLLPAAFIWYVNASGIYKAARQRSDRKRAVIELTHEAVRIIRNRQALYRQVREALEAAEAKQATLVDGPSYREAEETEQREWTMPAYVSGVTKPHLVIVGGGAGGTQAAITAQRLENVGHVTVIRKEKKVIVPCGIPDIFHSGVSAEEILIPDTLLGNAELVIDEVTSIDRKSKTVTLAGHNTVDFIGYDKLILATGSHPAMPQIPGRELGNVFTVGKDMDYLKSLGCAVSEANDALIIGGGLAGVEFAGECRKRGANVTIVELLPHCLLSNWDQEFCAGIEYIL